MAGAGANDKKMFDQYCESVENNDRQRKEQARLGLLNANGRVSQMIPGLTGAAEKIQAVVVGMESMISKLPPAAEAESNALKVMVTTLKAAGKPVRTSITQATWVKGVLRDTELYLCDDFMLKNPDRETLVQPDQEAVREIMQALNGKQDNTDCEDEMEEDDGGRSPVLVVRGDEEETQANDDAGQEVEGASQVLSGVVQALGMLPAELAPAPVEAEQAPAPVEAEQAPALVEAEQAPAPVESEQAPALVVSAPAPRPYVPEWRNDRRNPHADINQEATLPIESQEEEEEGEIFNSIVPDSQPSQGPGKRARLEFNGSSFEGL